MALLVAIAIGCGPVTPSVSAPVSSGEVPPTSAATAVSAVPSLPPIPPGAGRLVWLVDRGGHLGVWTTDLAGGDVAVYATGLDEAGIALRDARLVGDDVAFIRETPATPTSELWVVSRGTPPRLLLDRVATFVVSGEEEVLAVRDEGAKRAVWRVPTTGAPPLSIAQLPLPPDMPSLGPFGFAISADGRTVAAGWVGGPLEIIGPIPSSHRDLGAPLIVDDDGRLLAVTGRVGEAYRVDGGGLVELAPADSDPIVLPGTGTMAWAAVGEDGRLLAVEVRDLSTGANETLPATGLPTNVTELSATHVIVEATAFDPLERTVGIVDRRDGRYATFQAAAPPD
jgi:hypothetical protein